MYIYRGVKTLLRFDTSKIDTVSIPVKAAELLLCAPAGAVKLYLYGLLRQSAEDMSKICAETGMS